MIWHASHRADPAIIPIADRHYNRQKPGTPQVAPPGRCCVFTTQDARAFWITSWPFAEYVRHAWAGAWVCSAFRREDGPPASEMIRDALAATRAHFGEPPALGMVTFINQRHVRPTIVRGKPVWGWTWTRVGFRHVGKTKGGLLALQIAPADIPAAAPAKARSTIGLPLFSTCEAVDA